MYLKTLFAKFIILKTIRYCHVYVTKFVYNDIVHITSKKYGVSHHISDSQDSPRPGLGGTHHFPPYSVLRTSPRGPHPNGFLSRDFQVGVPKLPRLGLLQFWGTITLRANLRWRWGLKQSCISRQELSNAILHATCTQGNRVNSWLLVLGSQIVNLTLDLSFGHNLCFRCSNGRCKPILDIYILRAF